MNQLSKLLAGLSTTQRIVIVVAALLTGGGLLYFSRWKHEGDFRALYTAMALEDASGVVQKLRETGVEYRLSENGTSVLVPSAKLAESRIALAAAGLPKSGRIGFELFDKTNFGATDFVEHINYKRALEGELERSVMSIGEVEQARIHLTLPKESVFLEKQQPAKASVMLKLRPGGQVSQQNVLAITNMVASAVEGLSPESVSVVDMNGTLLRRPKRGGEMDGAQVTSETMEVRQQMERDLIAKIQNTLEPLIGPDRFRAGASVECDLTSGEQQEETYDPTRSVMSSSQKTEDVTDRGAAASGIPGTASNLPGASPLGHQGSGGVARRTENVAFQSSRVVRHTRIPQGVVKRMSLSVLVDNNLRWEGEGAARQRVLEPPPPEKLKTIRELVAAATGFNAERGDQLIVESLPFEISLNAEPPPLKAPKPVSKPATTVKEKIQEIKSNPSLLYPTVGGVVVVLVLIVVAGRLLRKKVKAKARMNPMLEDSLESLSPRLKAEALAQLGGAPEPAAIAPPVDDSPEVAARVRQVAQSDMALAANVIRLWLHQNKVSTK